MLAVLRAFWNIVLRRLGPEDLPDSGFLLAVSLTFYVLLQLPVAAPSYGFGFDLWRNLLLDALMLFAFVWILLRLAGHAGRFRQTITALLGCGALLTLVAIPFSIWWQSGTDEGVVHAGPTAALIVIIIWSVMVNAHILSRALSRSFGVGILLSVAYLAFNYQAISSLAGS